MCSTAAVATQTATRTETTTTAAMTPPLMEPELLEVGFPVACVDPGFIVTVMVDPDGPSQEVLTASFVESKSNVGIVDIVRAYVVTSAKRLKINISRKERVVILMIG